MSFTRRHFWVVHLLTILVCAFFAARATGQLVAGLLLDRMPTGQRTVASAVGGEPEAALPPRVITAVVSRNIFCSTCEASAGTESPSDDGAGPPSDAAPTKTALKLRLLATLVEKEDPGASIAFIVDLEKGQTGVHGVGSRLADGVSILEIALRQVLLKNGQRKELLTLGDGEAEPVSVAGADKEGPFTRPDPLEGLEGISNGIRHLAEKKYSVDRAVLTKLLSDQSLFSGVRTIPSSKDGQVIGFAVFARVGSIPSLLGLFSGDVLQGVNGQSFTTPEKALEVVRGLRGSSQLTLSFLRRGVPLTHDYAIK